MIAPLCQIQKSATQRTPRITENHRENPQPLPAVPSVSALLSRLCPLWLFSVYSVLISESRDQQYVPCAKISMASSAEAYGAEWGEPSTSQAKH